MKIIIEEGFPIQDKEKLENIIQKSNNSLFIQKELDKIKFEFMNLPYETVFINGEEMVKLVDGSSVKETRYTIFGIEFVFYNKNIVNIKINSNDMKYPYAITKNTTVKKLEEVLLHTIAHELKHIWISKKGSSGIEDSEKHMSIEDICDIHADRVFRINSSLL